MTHPAYTAASLESMTINQLKTIAGQLGAIPDGNKSYKKTWLTAIIEHQTRFSPVKVAAMDAHIQMVFNRTESVTVELPVEISVESEPTESISIETDNYQPTPRTHADDVAFAAAMGMEYDDVFGLPLADVEEPAAANIPQLPRNASIVFLIPIIALCLVFGIIKFGISSIVWLITLAAGLFSLVVSGDKYQFGYPKSLKTS